MTNYFNETDLEKAKRKRTILLSVFFITTAAFVAFLCVMLFVVYMRLPYESDRIISVKIITYSVIVIYVAFCFIFLGVTYKRAKRYHVFLNNLKTGLKETSTAVFLDGDETLHEKDGVDCKSLIFIEWNKYKKDYFERKVMIFYDKPFPDIPSKAEVRFVTHGNFLISYEINNSDSEETNEIDNNGNR